jgi:SAM-dependent methyltransferase
MEFTGERVVPGKVGPDLLNEHLSRYYFAQPMVARKSVLDLGCGTGYGSFILAESARRVFGIDISEEAVGFARQNYFARNISFSVADCSNLSLATGSLDSVVCFEVIEHLPEQESLLREAHRVLKADGFLIISTPNRVFYTDERNEINPFHSREFNFEEFRSCLETYFSKVQVYFQNHTFSIFIGDPRCSIGGVSRFGQNIESLESSANFFVAVCSKTDQNWPCVSNLIHVPSTGNLLREKEQRIQALESKINELDTKVLQLQKEYDERSRWCLELDREIEERDVTIINLRREWEERTAWARRLSQEVTEKDDRILKLQSAFDERTEWALRLESELKVCQEQLKVRQGRLEKIKKSKLFKLSTALRLVPKIE